MKLRWRYLLLLLPILLWGVFKLSPPEKPQPVEQPITSPDVAIQLNITPTVTATNRPSLKKENSTWSGRFDGRELQNGPAPLKLASKLRATPKNLYTESLGPKVKEELNYIIYESSSNGLNNLLVAIDQESNRTTILKNRVIFKSGDINRLNQIAKEFDLTLDSKFDSLHLSIYHPNKAISILNLLDQIKERHKEISVKIEAQDSLPILE